MLCNVRHDLQPGQSTESRAEVGCFLLTDFEKSMAELQDLISEPSEGRLPLIKNKIGFSLFVSAFTIQPYLPRLAKHTALRNGGQQG